MRGSVIGIGDTVGNRFRLIGEIGEGGMGRVFEAVDLRYDRSAAVKVVSRRLATSPEFRERFEREASAAQRANHPHVLPIWDHGAEGEQLYLATPLCDTDLAAIVQHAPTRLNPDAALGLLAQIAWALDWAHGRGVVHRDVKPDNILLVFGPSGDHAYLGDFGMAKAVTDQTLTIAGHVAGFTPAYAAPEQWLGEPVTPAVDQYALAGTLWTCLAGAPPFYPRRDAELRAAHLTGTLAPLPADADPRSARLEPVLRRGLAKDPASRFPSCGDLIAAARHALRDDAQPGDSGGRGRLDPRAPTDPEHPTSRRRGAAAKNEPAATVAEPLRETDQATQSLGARTGSASPALGAPHDVSAARAAVTRPMTPADDPEPPTEVAPQPGPGGRTPAGDGPAARPPRDAAAHPRSRRGRRLVVVLVGLVVLVGGAGVVLAQRGGPGTTSRGPGATTTPAGRADAIPVAGGPVDTVAGGGSLWVVRRRTGAVSRLAPRSGRPVGKPIPATPFAYRIAVGAGAVYVLSSTGAYSVLGLDGRHASAYGEESPRLPTSVDDATAGFGALWVVSGTDGEVLRYPLPGPRTLAAEHTMHYVGLGASAIATGAGAAWVVTPDAGSLRRLEPATGMPSRRPLAVGQGGSDVAVGPAGVWVANPGHGRLQRIDPSGARVAETARVPRCRGGAVAVGRSAAYYLCGDTGSVTTVRPGRAASTSRRAAAPGASAITYANGALWIADYGRDRVWRLPAPEEGH